MIMVFKKMIVLLVKFNYPFLNMIATHFVNR